jgi:hypothetical protein
MTYVSVLELTWLLQAAYEAQVGPFAREMVTPQVLLNWLIATPEGRRWLMLYMEYPQPPQLTTLGRAIAQIPFIATIHRVLPNYRTGGHRRVYIFNRHEYWKQASRAEMAWCLQLDEWLLDDYSCI